MRKGTAAVLIVYVGLTVYAVISVIAGWPMGSWLTPVNTLTGFAFSILHAGQRYGWKSALVLLLSVFLVSLGLESLGVATGLVYGPYHYTDQLGVKFLGLVPLLIPVAWFMMMYPATVMAELIISHKKHDTLWMRILTAALAGFIMTAWDVAMDPMMVRAGHWVWEVQGAFFGVPVQNYFGWWLTSFLSIGVFLLGTMKMKRPEKGIPARWAVISYTTQASATIITDAFIGLSGAGMAGFFAMLPWIIIGWIFGGEKGGKDAGKDQP